MLTSTKWQFHLGVRIIYELTDLNKIGYISTDFTQISDVLTDSTQGKMCSTAVDLSELCFDRLQSNWQCFDRLDRSKKVFDCVRPKLRFNPSNVSTDANCIMYAIQNLVNLDVFTTN